MDKTTPENARAAKVRPAVRVSVLAPQLIILLTLTWFSGLLVGDFLDLAWGLALIGTALLGESLMAVWAYRQGNRGLVWLLALMVVLMLMSLASGIALSSAPPIALI